MDEETKLILNCSNCRKDFMFRKHKTCDPCLLKMKIRQNKKKEERLKCTNQCGAYIRGDVRCDNRTDDTYCKVHSVIEKKIIPEKLEDIKIVENINECNGIIKSTCKKCEKKRNGDTLYCKSHAFYTVLDDNIRSGKNTCSNFKRTGCTNTTKDEKTKRCEDCNEKCRETERKERDKTVLNIYKKEHGTDFEKEKIIERTSQCLTITTKKYQCRNKAIYPNKHCLVHNVNNYTDDEKKIEKLKKTIICRNCEKTYPIELTILNKCSKCIYAARLCETYRNNRDIYLVKRSEIKRKNTWYLTDDFALSLVKSKCYYCNITGIPLGIDRLDSDYPYIIENCVPCCPPCNYMKNVSSENNFLNKISYLLYIAKKISCPENIEIFCKDIVIKDTTHKKKITSKYSKPDAILDITDEKNYIKKNLFICSLNSSYSKFISECDTKTYNNGITEDIYYETISKPCNYCSNLFENRPKGSETIFTERSEKWKNDISYSYGEQGIDRINSNICYMPDNIVPCCYTCNTMKNKLDTKEFYDHMERIYSFKILKVDKNIYSEKYILTNIKPKYHAKFNNKRSYYKKLIYDGKIKITTDSAKIIFCNNSECIDVWNYYAYNYAYTPNYQNCFKILVMDTITNKYVGFFGLEQDKYCFKSREKFTKMDEQQILLHSEKLICISSINTLTKYLSMDTLINMTSDDAIISTYNKKYNTNIYGLSYSTIHTYKIKSFEKILNVEETGIYTFDFEHVKILLHFCKEYFGEKLDYGKIDDSMLIKLMFDDKNLSDYDYFVDFEQNIYFKYIDEKFKELLLL